MKKNVPPQIEDDEKSKSQVKREMAALQELSASIVEMNDKQLAKVPLDDEMKLAVAQAKKLPQRDAKRRLIQFLAKLIHKSGEEPIVAAVEQMQEHNDQHIHRQHQVERYRDLLIDGDTQALQSLVTLCHGIDVQHLRQLVRSAQQEREQNQPQKSARKLFAFILEAIEKN